MAHDNGINRSFGVVFFDDPTDPSLGGWAATAADKTPAFRIDGPSELATDHIWWSNMSYEFFFRKSEAWRNPWLRHDKYLVVSPTDVLREWGYDPKVVSTDFVCKFCAEMMDRVMSISFMLIRELNPKARMDQVFVGKTLRDDLRGILPEPEFPKGEAAAIMKSGQAWEEFTATTVFGPKGGRTIMLRKPRISYCWEMLQTPVPKGPFDIMSRGDLKSKTNDRVEWLKALNEPAMVEVAIQRMDGDISQIYGFGNATDKNSKKIQRSWVAHPEFAVLSEFAEVDVKSVWLGKEYSAIVPELPDAVKDFLSDRFSDCSWSAGVVAESLWRAATLSEDKSKVGTLREGEDRAHTSWQGAWIKAADKSSMFLSAKRLTELGYAVVSYGLGWVRCRVLDEQVSDLINDGMTLGMIPQVIDVPTEAFDPKRSVHWQGDPKAGMLAQLTLTNQTNMLWNLDKLPTLPERQREVMLKSIIQRRQEGKL